MAHRLDDLNRPLFIHTPVPPCPSPNMADSVLAVLAYLVTQADQAQTGDRKWLPATEIAHRTGLSDGVVRQRLTQMAGCGWAMCARRVVAGERDASVYRVTEDGRAQALDYGCAGEV